MSSPETWPGIAGSTLHLTWDDGRRFRQTYDDTHLHGVALDADGNPDGPTATYAYQEMTVSPGMHFLAWHEPDTGLDVTATIDAQRQRAAAHILTPDGQSIMIGGTASLA